VHAGTARFTRRAVAWENAILTTQHLGAEYPGTEPISDTRPREARDRRVLLVGGAGYIGSVLTDHLLGNGFEVRCFDALLFDNQSTVIPYLAKPGYEFHRGDLVESAQLDAALEGIDDVVLLAGLVGDPITKKFPEAAKHINHEGYFHLLDQLNGRGLGRVIFLSTCSNYGLIPDDHLADEEHELAPLSTYAEAKVAVERELLSREGAVDYAPTILRFATAFGLSPRMRFDLTISEFARETFIGNELVVFDADTWRPYCHVRDFAELVTRVLRAPSDDVAFEVFNAGGDANNFTKRMIVDAIRAQLPDAKVRFTERGGDPRNYRVDFAKVRERLGFEPAYSVEDGICELIAAMRQGLFARIDSPARFFGNYEIDYPASS
jgi:nucleoside-diphosphate-sugar epimerase